MDIKNDVTNSLHNTINKQTNDASSISTEYIFHQESRININKLINNKKCIDVY